MNCPECHRAELGVRYTYGVSVECDACGWSIIPDEDTIIAAGIQTYERDATNDVPWG